MTHYNQGYCKGHPNLQDNLSSMVIRNGSSFYLNLINQFYRYIIYGEVGSLIEFRFLFLLTTRGHHKRLATIAFFGI